MESLPDVYSLTGLQIGDIQSHVSHAFLYVAAPSKRLFVMVDNRPWSMDKHSSSARIWQLMVAKYRMSPFTNTRAHKTLGSNDDHECYNDNSNKPYGRWFHLVNSKKLQEKYFHAVRRLSNSLHGFIVFEVAWKDVHGINYRNELQNDTSFALEVRTMKKWEFLDPEHASGCISLWFSDCTAETQSLKDYLKKLTDIFKENSNSQPPSKLEEPSSDVLPEDEFSDIQENIFEPEHEDIDGKLCDKEDTDCNNGYNVDESLCGLGSNNQEKFLMSTDEGNDGCVSPTHYSDTLMLIRFSDSLLPFKLKQIIMSDIRLLTLLESGLPSWVIFFQSYPLFCNFYRPWMRLLVRGIHTLISLVTVLVGFYDLYKNVPLLKDTASRIFGPLFDWIESWDMITRLRYLGTMYFLQNLQRSLNWLLALARTMKAILSVISRPLFGPIGELFILISPLWNAFAETFEVVTSTICSAGGSIYALVTEFAEVFMWPFEIIYIYICTTATLLYPIFHGIWELLRLPVRFVVTFLTYFLSLLTKTFYFLKDIWETLRSTFQLSSLSESEQSAVDNSALKELWNDLFSQVFRALRGVINGLLAFFISCNRHRLSLSNHSRAFVHRLSHSIHINKHHKCHCKEAARKLESSEKARHECDLCK